MNTIENLGDTCKEFQEALYTNDLTPIILYSMRTPDAGFLLINKPQHITSFAVVKHIRNLIGTDTRVGHAGTLDPFATGLLIIAIDRKATKHLERLLSLSKTYIAKGKLGELTDTLDYTGEILQTDQHSISKQELEKALSSFGTSYIQTAPIYSALRHKGMRLCDLTRQKQLSIERLEAIATLKKRAVHLYHLELIDFSLPHYTIKAQVSSGTYIRSLVNDIAKRAGSIATTYELERTAIGPFSKEKALSLEELSSSADIEKNLIPVDSMLAKAL